eukprot:3581772-Rhodomonas_salina.1
MEREEGAVGAIETVEIQGGVETEGGVERVARLERSVGELEAHVLALKTLQVPRLHFWFQRQETCVSSKGFFYWHLRCQVVVSMTLRSGVRCWQEREGAALLGVLGAVKELLASVEARAVGGETDRDRTARWKRAAGSAKEARWGMHGGEERGRDEESRSRD